MCWLIESVEKQYSSNILKAIEASVQSDGYVPTGLYDFKTGKQTSSGFGMNTVPIVIGRICCWLITRIVQPKHTYVQSTLETHS